MRISLIRPSSIFQSSSERCLGQNRRCAYSRDGPIIKGISIMLSTPLHAVHTITCYYMLLYTITCYYMQSILLHAITCSPYYYKLYTNRALAYMELKDYR